MYPYICKIEYYDSFQIPYKLRKTNLLIYANGFDEAMTTITNYVDEDLLEAAHILCVGDEYSLFEVSDEVVEELINKYNGDTDEED